MPNSVTSLGLGGKPAKFLGAYIKNISSNLGMSISPSTVNITLVEDTPNNVFFEEPDVGSFQTVSIGSTWTFGGVITKIEKDIRQISGRTIRINMSDPREVMRSIPVIVAPGFQNVTSQITNVDCSVIDIFGAYAIAGGLLNLSGWTSAGIEYRNLTRALRGDNIRYGDTLIPIYQQIAKFMGERYRFNLDDLNNIVDPFYRINTNLTPISSVIEDLSSKFSFDWFITSTRASDGIIDVRIRIIDRSKDQTTISLPSFLSSHDGRVISCSSGVELRNEVSVTALVGASVEQLLRVDIRGQANEPIDLTTESGTNAYLMTEDEMRVVLAGRHQWELWLSMQLGDVSSEVSSTSGHELSNPDNGFSGRGYSRYGGILNDFDIAPMFYIRSANDLQDLINGNVNIPKNPLRNNLQLIGAQYVNSGRIFEKLRGHSERSYGRRWVHGDISDEIIDSAWTKDAVGAITDDVSIGPNDPNSFFRQSNGRTRAYVEFTNNEAGGAFSLGLGNLRTLFGNQDIFNGVTAFGNTFNTILPGLPGQIGGVLTLELSNDFDPFNHTVASLDKSEYVYNDTFTLVPSTRSSLYIAASVEKDGVICINGPVLEPALDPDELLGRMIAGSGQNILGNLDAQQKLINIIRDSAPASPIEKILFGIDQNGVQRPRFNNLVEVQRSVGPDADGNNLPQAVRFKAKIKKIFGNFLFNTSVRAYQPSFAFIPVKSRYNRYGPVFSQNLANSHGRLDIIQDDGFSPWEFGGASLMLDAMQRKVNFASSNQTEVFSASIVIEGYPQFNLGDSLEKNANINNMSITFGDGGVTTSYGLQTFVRKFGEFNKDDWARIALFANSGALRISPQQMTLFNSRDLFRVVKQSEGFVYPDISTGGAASLG